MRLTRDHGRWDRLPHWKPVDVPEMNNGQFVCHGRTEHLITAHCAVAGCVVYLLILESNVNRMHWWLYDRYDAFRRYLKMVRMWLISITYTLIWLFLRCRKIYCSVLFGWVLLWWRLLFHRLLAWTHATPTINLELSNSNFKFFSKSLLDCLMGTRWLIWWIFQCLSDA